jgi:hypothetical protein
MGYDYVAMRRTLNVLIVVGGSAVLAVAAGSIVANIRNALGRRRHPPRDEAAERRERLRRALAPITVKLDPEIWGDWLKPLPDDFDLDAFRRSMPILDPPLSQTIIEERESST